MNAYQLSRVLEQLLQHQDNMNTDDKVIHLHGPEDCWVRSHPHHRRV
jgi:hypothetical protein